MPTATATVPAYTIQLRRERSVSWPARRCETPQDAMNLARKYLGEPDREHFVVICIDAQRNVIGIHTVAIGDRTTIHLTAAEVFKIGMLLNAAAVVLAHNHPSGEPGPSFPDRMVTVELEIVGSLLGIPVFDHVVLGSPSGVSMRAAGLMSIPLDGYFDCTEYLRQRARRQTRQTKPRGKAKEEAMPEPTRAEWMAVPLEELRAFITERTDRTSIRAVAASLGLGHSTLALFVNGKTKRPHPRLRRPLALWYLRETANLPLYQTAVDTLVGGIDDPIARSRIEAEVLTVLAARYEKAGLPLPAWLKRMRG
jgi:DNA repair protein RadC